MDDIELEINGKRVFISEQHHHVLKFWSKFKEQKPYLLTFDHHTDLHRAFQGELNRISLHTKFTSQVDWDIAQNKLLIELIENNFTSINELKHDEHIDAALKLGFINKALVYSYDSYRNRPDRVYCINGNENYANQLVINNPRNYDNNNEVISSKELTANFKLFNLCIPQENWINNFILDIDLDFFKTCKSIKPNDISFFKMLIEKSIAISIAKESVFVNSWKTEFDDKLSVEFLLNELIALIQE
ncbi:MAG: UPF0489 family protein [Flavobacterium sp.]|jgi:hypothetical protein|nr:UPF0489 family protein [Flavobacterium sp.]